MAASIAIQSFITILSTLPAAVIQPSQIGQLTPSATGDLPRIAVSFAKVKEGGIGIGGTVGLAFDGSQWITSTGTSASGVLQVEIWTAAIAQMNQIADAVLALLADSATALFNGGFVRFETQTLRSVETVLLIGSNNPALHRVLEFSVVHEDVATLATGPGGTIQEVDVTINSQFNEKLTVK